MRRFWNNLREFKWLTALGVGLAIGTVVIATVYDAGTPVVLAWLGLAALLVYIDRD